MVLVVVVVVVLMVGVVVMTVGVVVVTVVVERRTTRVDVGFRVRLFEVASVPQLKIALNI